jgi:hypothetical protein
VLALKSLLSISMTRKLEDLLLLRSGNLSSTQKSAPAINIITDLVDYSNRVPSLSTHNIMPCVNLEFSISFGLKNCVSTSTQIDISKPHTAVVFYYSGLTDPVLFDGLFFSSPICWE